MAPPEAGRLVSLMSSEAGGSSRRKCHTTHLGSITSVPDTVGLELEILIMPADRHFAGTDSSAQTMDLAVGGRAEEGIATGMQSIADRDGPRVARFVHVIGTLSDHTVRYHRHLDGDLHGKTSFRRRAV